MIKLISLKDNVDFSSYKFEWSEKINKTIKAVRRMRENPLHLLLRSINVFVWMKINCLVKPTKEKLCSEIMGMMEGLGFMTTAALKAKP